MCDQTTLVPIPDLLWRNNGIYEFEPDHPEYGIDELGRKCLAIDTCIVPAVKHLWNAGIVTLSCCCGHGDPWGVITVQTQQGVGQRGAMTLRVDRYEQLVSAEAQLAAAQADLATMREQQDTAAIEARDATVAAQAATISRLREGLAESLEQLEDIAQQYDNCCPRRQNIEFIPMVFDSLHLVTRLRALLASAAEQDEKRPVVPRRPVDLSRYDDADLHVEPSNVAPILLPAPEPVHIEAAEQEPAGADGQGDHDA